MTASRPTLALTSLLLCSLALPAGAKDSAATSQPTKKAAAKALPTAEAVLANHLEAVGGKDAVTAPKRNRVQKGTFSIPMQGLSGTLTLYAARPSSMKMVMESPMMGQITGGFHDGIGWSKDPFTGARIIDGAELEGEKIKSAFDADAQIGELYETTEMVGIEEFEGRPCYKLRMVDAAGNESFSFFDVETHRMAGQDMKVQTPMGEFPTRTILDSYKAFNGHSIPTKTTLRTNAMGVTMDTIMTVESVLTDVEDFPSLAPPPEILELAAASKGK